MTRWTSGWARLELAGIAKPNLPAAFEEFRDSGAEAGAAVVEEPLPDLKNPNTLADVGIPTHASAKSFLGMGQEPEK
jgi:hypothetical protein